MTTLPQTAHEVLEMAAMFADFCDKSTHPADVADGIRALKRSIPNAPVLQPGEVAVPMEPTSKIRFAICDAMFGDWRKEELHRQAECQDEANELYRAMLAAAQPAAEEKK